MKSTTSYSLKMTFTFEFPLTEEQYRTYDKLRLDAYTKLVKAEMDYKMTKEIKDMFGLDEEEDD